MFPQDPMYSLATPIVYDVAPDDELMFMFNMLNITVAVLVILMIENMDLRNNRFAL